MQAHTTFSLAKRLAAWVLAGTAGLTLGAGQAWSAEAAADAAADQPADAAAPAPAPAPAPAETPAETPATALTASESPSAQAVSRFAQMASLLALPAALPLNGASGASATGRTLDLAQALAAALDRSTDVEAARHRLASFDASSLAARGVLLPQADLRGVAGRGELASVDPVSRLPRRDATLTVRQSLLDLGARRELTRRQLLVESAQLQQSGAISQALLEGGQAYLEVLRQRVVMELGADHQRNLDELLRIISDRAAAGGTSAAERERVRSRVSNLRSTMADSSAGLAAALRNLQRLTGLEAPGLGVGGPLPVPTLGDLAEVLEQARAGNADLLAARAEALAAEADVRTQRARHLPRLDIELTHNRSANMGGNLGRIEDSRVMLNLTVPLFHGGSDQAEISSAISRRLERDAKTLGVERRLAMEVESAFANLTATQARFDSVRDEVAANRSVVDAFRAQLVGGNRQLLDVLDAYQRLYQSRTDLAQLLVTDAQTQLRLAHLNGTLSQRTLAAAAAADEASQAAAAEAAAQAAAEAAAKAFTAVSPQTAEGSDRMPDAPARP